MSKNEVDKEYLNSTDFRLKLLGIKYSQKNRRMEILQFAGANVSDDILSDDKKFLGQLKGLPAKTKSKILAQWDALVSLSSECHFLSKKFDTSKAKLLSELSELIANELEITHLRTERETVRVTSEKQIEQYRLVFLGFNKDKTIFRDGKPTPVSTSYYTEIIFRDNSSIVEFRKLSSPVSNLSDIFQKIGLNLRENSTLVLTKSNIIMLAKSVHARAATIEYKTEKISERSYKTEVTDLFKIQEFMNEFGKEISFIQKIFVTFNFSFIQEIIGEVSVRIFTSSGKMTFTGFTNEQQIARTITEIEEIGKDSSSPRTSWPLDEFFTEN